MLDLFWMTRMGKALFIVASTILAGFGIAHGISPKIIQQLNVAIHNLQSTIRDAFMAPAATH